MSAHDLETRITVAADWQLANKRFYRERVWQPARALHEEIGSYANWRRVLNMVETYDGRLYLPDQRPWHHEEINDLFSDPTNRWMGYFLQADVTGEAPKSYSQKFERLRAIELYCRLMRPEAPSQERIFGPPARMLSKGAKATYAPIR